MRLLALLLLCCACSPLGNKHPLVSVNIVDRNGFTEAISATEKLKNYERVDFLEPQPYQKVLRVFAKSRSGISPAIVTAYHDNGQLKQLLHIENSRAHGKYKEWYPSGQLKVEGEIVGGKADLTPDAQETWLFDKMTIAWDQNGGLEAKIPYLKGVLHGESRFFHPGGKLWKLVPYTEGRLNGAEQVFLPSGQLLQRTTYKEGKKSGPTERFWPNNQLAAGEVYRDNLLQTGTYFDQEGKQITSLANGNGMRAVFGRKQVQELHQYRLGRPEGIIQELDQGELIRSYHVKESLKHGREVVFGDRDATGKRSPKLAIEWANGLIQGLVETWYVGGAQQSQREMSQNKRHGLSTSWYQDGSLMMVEQYDSDQLDRGEYYRKGAGEPAAKVIQGKGVALLFDGTGGFLRKITYESGKPIP